MWLPWDIDAAMAWPLAAALGLVLALALAILAHRLPRAVLGDLPSGDTSAHRRYRSALVLMGPIVAIGCVWGFGPTPVALAALVLILVLLALAWVDLETGLLPDLLTLPLLWLGLLVNLDFAFSTLPDAVMGAVAGYLLLYFVAGLFHALTGREGMGRGDFKLLAALGAWLGWGALPSVVLISSVLGLTVALLARCMGRLAPGQAFSFGPFLAVAGIIAMVRYALRLV